MNPPRLPALRLIPAGIALLAALTALAAWMILAGSQPAGAARLPALPPAPNRLILTLKALPGGAFTAQNSGWPSLDIRLRRLGVTAVEPLFDLDAGNSDLKRRLGLDRIFLLRLPPGSDLEAARLDLAADPAVQAAEADYAGRGAWFPNDADFSQQWGLHNTGQSGGLPDADIDAPEAWQLTTGSSATIIAVIDSGADYDHPDLAGKLLPGYDFVNSDTDAQDDHGHGTHVAGIAAAWGNNGTGVAGVCWGCRVLPLKALNDQNWGYYTWWSAALEYAVDHGATIINMSMGGLTHANYLQAAIQYAYQAGIPVVAAMMNDGDATVYYPAAYPETIAVGATDRFDHRAYFSNYSAHIDLIAPGQSIYSSLWNNTYISWSGTSMAAPHVAGALGLLQALEPGLSVETQRSRLYAASDDQVGQAWEDTPGWDIYSGAGRLNLDRLLRSSHARLSGLNLTRPPDGLPGVTYTFTASVEPPNAMQPVTYTWNADGQTPLVHTGGLSDTAAFAWPASGSQTITVTAQNPLNGIEIIFEFLVRVPVTPTAAFTALPSQGIAPLAVTFENTSVGDYLSSAWDFGDGAASSRQHPGHVYLLPGSYTVTLSVSAAWGSDSLAIPAFIQVFPGESVYLPLLWR